jgi:ABC-type arginine transport system permease subunit
LWTITAAGLLSVWIVAFQTSTYEARYVFVGLAAIAALAALGLERWKLPFRFVLPAMGLIGTLVAIQQNVLAVHWN